MEKRVCETTFDVLDPAIKQGIWAVYVAAFADAANRCIQEQSCYDQSKFEATLSDHSYIKFVLREGNEILAFCLGTNDLEAARIAYVNPVRLKSAFPEESGRGEIWYVTALAVRPDLQGTNCSDIVIDAVAQFVDARNGVIAFDFASDKHPQFPQYALHQFRKAKVRHGLSYERPEYVELGSQTYGVIKFPGGK